MGFAAPLVGAISGGAGVLGGIFGGKKSKQEKQLMAEQLNLAKMQEARANEQFGIAKGYLPQFDKMLTQALGQYNRAQGAYDTSQKFYQDILKGGESALDALVGPQRSAVNRAYQSELTGTATRGPRGGGTNQRLQNLDADRQGRLIDIALGARPMAAQGIIQTGQGTADIGNAIAGLGSQYGNLALGFTGAGNQSLGQGSNTLSALLGSEQNAAARRAGAIGGAGESLGNLFFLLGRKQGWF